MTKKKNILIIGGGTSGISLALALCENENYNIQIFEKEKQLGQKLLVAGKGGFNISNNLSHDKFIKRYTPSPLFEKVISNFTPNDLRNYLDNMGFETYVGSSGKIFPKEGLTVKEILKKVENKLHNDDVKINLNSKFIDFNENQVVIETNNNKKSIAFDYLIFALGGASWEITGSDGKWTEVFKQKDININKFQASNCGLNINLPQSITNNHLGKPLKNIAISCNNKSEKGEAVITQNGLEGNAIYPIIPEIRNKLNNNVDAVIEIDFKPQNSEAELIAKSINTNSKQYAKSFNLTSNAMALIKAYTSKETFLDPKLFAISLKKIRIPAQSLRPINEAISTIGGVNLNEINDNFSLKKYPNVFVAGEMLDWDAPTGGFLLQACISISVFIAKDIEKHFST